MNVRQLTNIEFAEKVEKHELWYNYNVPGYSRKHLTWQEIVAKVKTIGMYV